MLSPTRSSKRNTPLGPKPAKRPRTNRHSPSKSDINTMLSDLMQQEFRRRVSFEEKTLELNMQVLEEIRATRREVTSFVREYRRRQFLALLFC